jgi:hypothetical protein
MAILTFNPREIAVKQGETFTVELYIKEVTNLWAFSLALKWKLNALKFLKVEAGDFLPNNTTYITFVTAESLCINSIPTTATTPPASGSGVLATITFQALETTTIEYAPKIISEADRCTTILADNEVNEIPYTTETAQITITHLLTVNSEPSGVTFTIDETSATTPWQAELMEGTYTITMPTKIKLNTATYIFKNWEDGSTNPTRTVNLTADTVITAYYEAQPPPPKHTLTVNSNPQGVPFNINGVKASTPWTAELEEGLYTITMPAEATVNTSKYTFKNWEDGSTNPVRTVNLTADTVITAYYELAPPVTYTLTVQVNNPNYGTTDTNYPPGTYTLPENAIVTVTAIPNQGYRFTNWTINDATSTENPITITIDKDYTLTANFEPIPPPELATLTGKVTGIFNMPLANIPITLNTYKTTTAKDGTYKFENIPPATYIIKVEHWLYQPFMESVTLNPGDNTLDIKLTIKTEYPAAALGALTAILIAIIWRR